MQSIYKYLDDIKKIKLKFSNTKSNIFCKLLCDFNCHANNSQEVVPGGSPETAA